MEWKLGECFTHEQRTKVRKAINTKKTIACSFIKSLLLLNRIISQQIHMLSTFFRAFLGRNLGQMLGLRSL